MATKERIMSPIILVAFPGLLFSVQPPTRHLPAKPALPNVTHEYQLPATDTCDTYIYAPNKPVQLYFNGQPVTPALLQKLGPLAAPLLHGLSHEHVG